MPFIKFGGVRYFTFNTFDHPKATHAVFSRRGGISPKPWESLNVGGLVGDDVQRVEYNRALAFQAVGRDPRSMCDVWQVHSPEVVCVDSPRPMKPSRNAGSRSAMISS